MSVPPLVAELMQRFEQHRDSYVQSQYKEAQLRADFIDPLFEALGWDVRNRQGYAEKFREVVYEPALKVAQTTEAPDYSFRVGGVRQFFVEVKKPAVNIGDSAHPAYQLRRYAWSAKLPLSILTDFEELAVYDCRVKPVKTDKASTARVLFINHKEYADRWDELAGIFSRQAVLTGSFDRYAESGRVKRGTTGVDAAFLQEIERWRELLARNLALRNRALSQRELNFAVQRTIDRIIFLRIAEDRGIEPYGTLMALQNGGQVYERLFHLFRQADDRYDSGLFYFRPEKGRSEDDLDALTPNLAVDDAVLKDIFKNLYYPDSPYEFSVLPLDILGQVYEQFLGKVIRLTAGHQARVEEKPEVRKAGGVYYTPTYIVDYIVQNTVGKLVAGKTPQAVGRLRILDPACGSGSFLLGAYQFLLDWHLRVYSEAPRKWSSGSQPRLYQAKHGEWRLTTGERKRILLNNIYGVDIDAQAVEVTKLSLSLKVLEGENEQTLTPQLMMFHERALPDLSQNIKCGNSLIGPDFYPGRQLSLLDEEEAYRINAFDWQAEFPEIIQAGGFDAVIGNPPYGMITDDQFKTYFQAHFSTTEGRFDTYELFIEQGVALCRRGGLLGYIVPSPLLSNLHTRKLRRYLLDHCAIKEIANFGMDVFADPTVHTCIVVVARQDRPDTNVRVRKQVRRPAELEAPYDYEIDQSELGINLNATIDIFIDPKARSVVTKMLVDATQLGDLCFIRQCIKTGDDTQYVMTQATAPGPPWKPTLRGRSISRYAVVENNLYVKYGEWLARNWANRSFYETPKVAIRETGSCITATIDLENHYLLSSLYSVYPRSDGTSWSLLYLLGILNSRLATYFVKMVALELTQGAFTKMRTNQLARLPIRTINFGDPADRARHDGMVARVERMLDLHKQLPAAQTPQARTILKRQIEATDREIDRLVYALYDLTEDEIRIVEGQ